MNASETREDRFARPYAAAGPAETGVLQARCACKKCLTYNECMQEKEELLFCLTGKSLNCTFEKKGCRCPSCTVKTELRLASVYPCIRGSEKERMNSET